MRFIVGLTLWGAMCAAHAEPVGMLIFPNSDFELGTLENWTREGDAFDFQPTYLDNVTARRADRRAMPQGEYWLGTFEKYQGRQGVERGRHQGDGPTGGLISKPFIIRLPVITFLLGGGDEDIEASLIVNGATVRTATGADFPLMRRVYWDVSEWEDEQAMIYLYDRASGFFGFICADDFRYLTEIPKRGLFDNNADSESSTGWTSETLAGGLKKRTSPKFTLEGEGIAFEMQGPAGTGARLIVDGEAVLTATPRSADTMKTHVWGVKPWKGKDALVEVFDESAAEDTSVLTWGFRWAR